MREARGRLPQLTQFYGLRPRDLDRMKYREVSDYLVYLDRFIAENGG